MEDLLLAAGLELTGLDNDEMLAATVKQGFSKDVARGRQPEDTISQLHEQMQDKGLWDEFGISSIVHVSRGPTT